MAHTANFRNLYDYSPIHAYQAPGYRGSSSTSSFHPVHPPEARNTPRHIVEDAALAPALLNFARNYLQTNTAVPGPLLLSTLPRLAYMAHTTSDSTEYNVHHLFDDVAAYGNFFVEGADALPPGSVRLMVCPTRHGIRPDGRSVRQGATRVIHEYKGRRALDTHADGITRLATANNGMGTELIRSPNETGSRSIIFKVNMRSLTNIYNTYIPILRLICCSLAAIWLYKIVHGLFYSAWITSLSSTSTRFAMEMTYIITSTAVPSFPLSTMGSSRRIPTFFKL